MIALPIDLVAAAHIKSLSAPVNVWLDPVQRGTPGPWRVSIASMLQYRARDGALRHALNRLFTLYPTPVDLSAAYYLDVESIIIDLPYSIRRARTLIQFSQRWVDGRWTDLRDLPGVGMYVAEAVEKFCFQEVQCQV